VNSSHEHIYYLDPWFIAREYEMRTNSSLPAKIQRTSSGGFDGSLGILKGRTASQESLEFNQSPEKTFWDISPQLAEFPEIELAPDIAFPSIFWTTGILAPFGESLNEHKSGQLTLTDKIWAFMVLSEKHDSLGIRLLSDVAHFRYNIHQLLEHPKTLGSHFRPRVHALLKSHGDLNNDRVYLATPLVIIETRD
jgi:hypothetical protein